MANRMTEYEMEKLRDEANDLIIFKDDFKGAMEKFKILLEHGDERAALDLADCCYCRGEYEEAMAWADKADCTELDPQQDGYLCFVLGDIYNENGQFEKARKWAELAVEAKEPQSEELLEAVLEELALQE